MRQSINLSNSLQGEYEDKKPLLSFTARQAHLISSDKPGKFFRHFYRLTSQANPHHNYILETAKKGGSLPDHIRMEREWVAPSSPFLEHNLRLKTAPTWWASTIVRHLTRLSDNTYLGHRTNPDKALLIIQVKDDLLVVDEVPWFASFEGPRFKERLRIHPYYLPLHINQTSNG